MATRIVAPGGATPHPQNRGAGQLAQALVFRPTGHRGYAYSVDATVPATGHMVAIHASSHLDEIDLTMHRDGLHCGFRISAADAQAIAAELIAAVDASIARAQEVQP